MQIALRKKCFVVPKKFKSGAIFIILAINGEN
jgi:hypothetical protein